MLSNHFIKEHQRIDLILLTKLQNFEKTSEIMTDPAKIEKPRIFCLGPVLLPPNRSVTLRELDGR